MKLVDGRQWAWTAEPMSAHLHVNFLETKATQQFESEDSWTRRRMSAWSHYVKNEHVWYLNNNGDFILLVVVGSCLPTNPRQTSESVEHFKRLNRLNKIARCIQDASGHYYYIT